MFPSPVVFDHRGGRQPNGTVLFESKRKMKLVKSLLMAIYLGLVLVVSTGCTGILAPQPTPITALPGWNLVWHDEFDGKAGTQPDAEKWGYDLGGQGWGNKEHEYYTDELENAAMDGNGALVITAIKLDESTKSGLKCWYGPCFYTSARILTKEKFEFTYGRVEARLKIPYGQGIWPAFWMLGNDIDTVSWPNCGEIDIMEHIGREPDIIHGTVHGPGYAGANGFGGPYVLKEGKFSDNFHVFAVEWEPQEIRWYIDGQQYFSVTPDQVNGEWVFDHPFFLILNLAVGGQWPGYPDATTVFPQTLQVDYVRVYQK
jgi:beta-glucanase (GH16 family)